MTGHQFLTRAAGPLAFCIAASLALPAPAATPGTASGTVTGDGVTATMKYAWAKREANPFDPKKTETVVLITDKPVDLAVWARNVRFQKFLWDEKVKLLILTINDERVANRVVVRLEKNEQHLSASSGVVTLETYELTGDSVEGSISKKAADFPSTEWTVSVRFKAPIVVPVDPLAFTIDARNGKPLPKGGGEPGKTWAEYHAAIENQDLAAIGKLLATHNNVFPGSVTDPDAKKTLERVTEATPKGTVVGGFATADRATLLIKAVNPYTRKRETKPLNLVKEGGVWKLLGS